MDKNDLVKEYITKQKARSNAFYDVMQKFLELPRESWKTKESRGITEYSTGFGPFQLFIKEDRLQEAGFYVIDIYTEKGIVYHSHYGNEVTEFYFNVDKIVREVDGALVTEIEGLNRDLEYLVNIQEEISKSI
jgi:hypothetical protein